MHTQMWNIVDVKEQIDCTFRGHTLQISSQYSHWNKLVNSIINFLKKVTIHDFISMCVTSNKNIYSLYVRIY